MTVVQPIEPAPHLSSIQESNYETENKRSFRAESVHQRGIEHAIDSPQVRRMFDLNNTSSFTKAAKNNLLKGGAWKYNESSISPEKHKLLV